MMILKKILDEVFEHKKGERIVILFDLPKENDANKLWKWRIKLAKTWAKECSAKIFSYSATYANNANLTEDKNLDIVLSKADIVIALTEFSATAPLHKFAKQYGFRAASMPGFNEMMMPALELDFKEIRKKVDEVYKKIDKNRISVSFEIEKRIVSMMFDLTNRKPIKDNAICNVPGQVINLPSGEAFIAPNDTKGSKTNGILPIQLKDTVHFFHVKNNRIISCETDNDLIRRIKEDPAVGNIAEVAFGVLHDFGIKPCGRILLDEKLGPHIALGRSDHFGGLTGPDKFLRKENIWHQDYVYIEECQPNIKIKEVIS